MNQIFNNLLVIVFAMGSALASPSMLASAEVSATCQLRDISNGKIADLCASIAKPERNLEYFHCAPTEDSGDTQVTHYIFQTTYTDKENYGGQALGGLFKGVGKSKQSVRELIDIVQVDEKVDGLSSFDVKFASHPNNLVFDLTIVSTDGEAMEGTITNTQSKAVTEVYCLDITLEK